VLGRDALSPVSRNYPRGFPYTGLIEHVSFQIEDDAEEIAHEVVD